MRKALVALALLLAGCTSSPAGDDDPVVADPPGGLDDALALYDAGNATANLHRLGQLDVGGAEVDTCGNFLYTDSGDHVDIVDISDPSAMTIVGTFQTP